MILRTIPQKFGIDESIAFTVLNRFIQAGSSLFVIFLVSRFLTKSEQGYYYTFSSIAALQVFFELGLSVVITQFVAHEFAFVNIFSDVKVGQSNNHLARISSMLRFLLKWYGIGAILLLVLVTSGGFIFFAEFNEPGIDVSWEGPWILLMVATSSNLFISAYIPLLEGLNKVKEVARFRTIQSLISFAVLFLSFIFGLGLYGLGFFALSNFIILSYWILNNRFKKLINSIWSSFNESIGISWKKEILPLQWRIGLSWLSGYFIFQIFNPIIFAIEGPVVAGQLGITLTAFNGISVIAMAWVSTKIPIFSMLIAQRKFEDLDILFFKAMKQSFFLITAGTLFFLLILGILQIDYFQFMRYMSLRFLPLKYSLFIGLTAIINQTIFSMASYLRSHKKEPLLANSVVGAIVAVMLGYFSAKLYGVGGMVVSNFLSTFFIGLGWVTYVFNTKRREWHI